MGSMLTRLAPLTTTGVGSLPFTRPGEAARHAIAAYELPFCPQLPRAYGDMVQEWLGGDPDRCGWAPDRDRQLPAAWDDLVLGLEHDPPSHGVIKLQVTGPLTLAMALERWFGAAGMRRRGSGARHRRTGRRRPSATSASAGELGLTALVIVDEPGLLAAQQLARPRRSGTRFGRRAPAWGLHVCGEVPWRLVDAAEPDVISYDLVRSGCGRVAQRVIRRLMRRGGRIIWGVVDPVAVERAVNGHRPRVRRGARGRRPPVARRSTCLTRHCCQARAAPAVLTSRRRIMSPRPFR